jgi:hypothetical protein
MRPHSPYTWFYLVSNCQLGNAACLMSVGEDYLLRIIVPDIQALKRFILDHPTKIKASKMFVLALY